MVSKHKRIHIVWTCGHCDKRHHWKWDRWDVCPGTITMECGKCEYGTRGQMNRDGQFVADEDTAAQPMRRRITP